MASETKPFQIALLMIFGAAAIIGVIVFATFSGGGSQKDSVGEVVIWGTLPREVMEAAIDEMQSGTEVYDGVSYQEYSAQGFESAFVEALAEGRGPDLVVITQADILSQQNRLSVIPFNSLSQRTFRDLFAEEGELFIAENGVLGLPAAIDPLIMYWNRDLFSSAGLAKPPEHWDEFYPLAERMTRRDGAGNVSVSAAALGEFQNIDHAKDILSALIMQGGNTIVGPQDGSPTFNFGGSPTESAILFYTEFANPIKSVYSWNRSLPSSRDAFLSGIVGVYFGYASELRALRAGNPNLNFDIATIPTIRPTEGTFTRDITSGKVYAFAVTRGTRNSAGAFQTAQVLISPTIAATISNALFIAPARRDLLSQAAPDDVSELIFRAALVARGWLDPNPEKTDAIFADMVESITTGRDRISGAISTAQASLQALLRE